MVRVIDQEFANSPFETKTDTEKAFAASVNRDTIRECEKIGLSLDEFVEISLGAMQGIAGRLGL